MLMHLEDHLASKAHTQRHFQLFLDSSSGCFGTAIYEVEGNFQKRFIIRRWEAAVPKGNKVPYLGFPEILDMGKAVD